MDLWIVSVWQTLTGHRVFNGFVDCECGRNLQHRVCSMFFVNNVWQTSAGHKVLNGLGGLCGKFSSTQNVQWFGWTVCGRFLAHRVFNAFSGLCGRFLAHRVFSGLGRQGCVVENYRTQDVQCFWQTVCGRNLQDTRCLMVTVEYVRSKSLYTEAIFSHGQCLEQGAPS